MGRRGRRKKPVRRKGLRQLPDRLMRPAASRNCCRAHRWGACHADRLSSIDSSARQAASVGGGAGASRGVAGMPKRVAGRLALRYIVVHRGQGSGSWAEAGGAGGAVGLESRRVRHDLVLPGTGPARPAIRHAGAVRCSHRATTAARGTA